jgi:hypothetical protein
MTLKIYYQDLAEGGRERQAALSTNKNTIDAHALSLRVFEFRLEIEMTGRLVNSYVLFLSSSLNRGGLISLLDGLTPLCLSSSYAREQVESFSQPHSFQSM